MADPLSSVTGVASGIDYRALVDAIIAGERKPADAAQAQIDLAGKRKEALGAWRGLLTTLQTALDKLRNGSGLGTLTATQAGLTAGGRALFSATADNTAVPGSYAIEVISLAQAEKIGGSAVADTAAALGHSGSFTINGASVTVDAADSLTAVRDKINAANIGETATKVSASILTVGPGDSRLILTSQVAGSAGIALAEGGGGVLAALGISGDAAVLVDGTDAQFTIDGLPMTRATNVIADAVAGVTLTLESAEPGTVSTLALTRDAEAGLTVVKELVDAYNAALAFVKSQGTPGATPPPLYGDSMLRLARATLSRGMLGIIAGDEGNTVTGSAAGLSLSKTGQLTIDETKLKANFGAAFDQLQALFASGSGGLDLDATLDTALLTNTGTVDMKSTFLTERMTLLQDRIDRIESRLERRRATLLAQFARMEATIGALQGQASFLTSQSSSLSRTRPS